MGRRKATRQDDLAARELMRLAPPVLCGYCRKPMPYGDPLRPPTRDHIWPRGMRNISRQRIGKIWCCQKCNQLKGDMSPSEWLEVVKRWRKAQSSVET